MIALLIIAIIVYKWTLQATSSEFSAGLLEAEDAPAPTAPAVANWSENLWWIAHDGKRGLGLYAHLGTMRHDFDVVRQTIIVFLPNGQAASDIRVGGLRGSRRVRGSTLTIECIEPFRQWQHSSNGVTQVSTLEELWDNTPRQGHRIPLRLQIRAECLGPMWVAGAGANVEEMQRQEWGKSHYQQTIRLVGTIELDGTTYEFDGTGVRNHSRGPRNFSNWYGHELR